MIQLLKKNTTYKPYYKKSIFTGCALLLCIVVFPCFVHGKDKGDNEHHDALRAYGLLLRAQDTHGTSLMDYIGKAEEAGTGIAIKVEIEDDTPLDKAVEVSLLQGNKIREVYCSLETGQVTETGSLALWDTLSSQIGNWTAGMNDMTVSLAQAIQTAQEGQQGIAYHARTVNSDGWISHTVYLLSGEQPVRLVIDAETGRIVGRRTSYAKHDDEDDDDQDDKDRW